MNVESSVLGLDELLDPRVLFGPFSVSSARVAHSEEWTDSGSSDLSL